MKKLILFLALAPVFVFGQNADLEISKNISTIAFGSCSYQTETEKQLWSEVNATNPDLWIWLGDNIYGDTEDMKVMRKKYDLQKSHIGYQRLIAKTDVIGIWDDHDFGVNDGGKEYLKKDESKAEMFRFLDVAHNHPAYERKGAYQSYAFNSGKSRVKIILLDARYFRDSLNKDEKNWNIPNETGEILGEDQWKWFEEQLSDSSVDLFIVGSGIQVIPEEHRFEKWANFPKELNRLYEVIKTTEKPVILLSGDRHISEVSKIELDTYPYPLYEFTSSSLTSPWGEPRKEPNKYREKEIIFETNFALLEIDTESQSLNLDISFIGKDDKVLQTHSISYRD